MTISFDFSEYYSEESVDYSALENKILSDAKQVYTLNNITTKVAGLELMQQLRLQIKAGLKYSSKKGISIEFSNMGSQTTYDPEAYDESEPCALLYLSEKSNTPLVIPFTILSTLSVGLDPTSFSAQLHLINAPEDKNLTQDQITIELNELARQCQTVHSQVSLSVHTCEFKNGTPFTSIGIAFPALKDLVVIPLDMFVMFSLLQS